MKLNRTAVRLLMRLRVVHRLPGRLRLHVPYLAGLGQDREDLVLLVARLLAVPEGIMRVEPDRRTGNVLITYAADQLTEKEILAFLEDVFLFYWHNRGRLRGVERERLPAMADRLEEIVRGAISRRIELDPNVEIGDDVLA